MPAKSKAQLGMMFHLENIGKVPKGTGKHWARESKKLKGGIRGLPEHVRHKKAVLRNQTGSEKAQEFVAGLFKQANGIAGSDPMLALTGGLSAPFATDTGNRMEAFGRGNVLGAGLGFGGGVGNIAAGVGSHVAGVTDPKIQAMLQLLGMAGGGYAGYKGTQALAGKPSWAAKDEKEKEKKPAPVHTPEKAAEAKSFIASLFKNAIGRGIGGMTGSSSSGGSAGGGGGSISGGGVSGGGVSGGGVGGGAGISGGASRVTSSISTTGPVGGGLRSPLGGAGAAPIMPGVAATALAAPVPRLGAMATVGS